MQKVDVNVNLIFGNVTVGYAKFKNILTILVSDTTSKNFNMVLMDYRP